MSVCSERLCRFVWLRFVEIRERAVEIDFATVYVCGKFAGFSRVGNRVVWKFASQIKILLKSGERVVRFRSDEAVRSCRVVAHGRR